MSEAIKEAMSGLQMEYRRIIALLGHSRAQRLGFQKDEEDFEKELLVIIKKIRNLESQTPKETTTEGTTDGQSNTTGNNGTAAA